MGKRTWCEDGWVFCMWFRHYITGKIVRRANGKPFRFKLKR